MVDYSFLNIEEEKIYIEDIAAIVHTPKNMDRDMETLIFYHGWSSDKETQRIRGLILAAAGYRVVIPDAINHGERDALERYGMNEADKFWPTVFKSIDEWDTLIEGLVSKYGIDRNKVGIIGNSMGGITAGGLYTENQEIKALVVLNGSMAWEHTNNKIKKQANIEMIQELVELEKQVIERDPIKNMDKLVDRPILSLHGEADEVLTIDSIKKFHKSIAPKYQDKERLKLIAYPDINHTISTNMMEEAIIFFNKYLKEE